jgi:hypothetical protein
MKLLIAAFGLNSTDSSRGRLRSAATNRLDIRPARLKMDERAFASPEFAARCHHQQSVATGVCSEASSPSV